jgi:hypothetical protein
MRTTIRLDAQLLTEAKRVAAENGTTLTALIEDSLRERLARRATLRRTTRFRFPTFKGEGLQPGIDLDDSASLLDRMEGRGGID